MTREIAICAKGLGKKYLIGHQTERERYTALRDVLSSGLRSLSQQAVNKLRGREISKSVEVEEFWALRDVAFEIRKGEVVGIIGRNGAGKSTLLKILSRITEPTEGRVELRGRVASLLEVGTGFHPELTGRENIYLNGAILGMRRTEIVRKFDEIVAFAEVDRFLDTPVKRYSSGMYVRLAFAVAAHLEPDILVVDEVLAVGDAEFQKKCLGKMQDVSRGGRTVLFVSHNMAAIQALCKSAILLELGFLIQHSTVSLTLERYLSRRNALLPTGPIVRRSLGPELALVEARSDIAEHGTICSFSFRLEAASAGQIRECALLIMTASGIRVAIVDLRQYAKLPATFAPGNIEIHVRCYDCRLIEGDYSAGLYIAAGDFVGDVTELVEFSVPTQIRADSLTPYPPPVRGFFEIGATATISTEIEGDALQKKDSASEILS